MHGEVLKVFIARGVTIHAIFILLFMHLLFLSLDPMNADEDTTFDDVDMKNDDDSDEEIKPPTPPPQSSKKRKSVTKTKDSDDYVTISVPVIKTEFSKSKSDVKETNSLSLDGELIFLLIRRWYP